MQVRSEITEFISLLWAERAQRVLEVGTSEGGTLYLLAWASADDARILSLDIKGYHALRRRLYRSFARARQTLDVLQVDSHLASTREAVERFFEGKPLDVLFIDGDHAYDGVRCDYELYEPLVRPGGMIAFHDIVDGANANVGGVPQLWKELSAGRADIEEIVADWSQGGYGIGIIRKE